MATFKHSRAFLWVRRHKEACVLNKVWGWKRGEWQGRSLLHKNNMLIMRTGQCGFRRWWLLHRWRCWSRVRLTCPFRGVLKRRCNHWPMVGSISCAQARAAHHPNTRGDLCCCRNFWVIEMVFDGCVPAKPLAMVMPVLINGNAMVLWCIDTGLCEFRAPILRVQINAWSIFSKCNQPAPTFLPMPHCDNGKSIWLQKSLSYD